MIHKWLFSDWKELRLDRCAVPFGGLMASRELFEEQRMWQELMVSITKRELQRYGMELDRFILGDGTGEE